MAMLFSITLKSGLSQNYDAISIFLSTGSKKPMAGKLVNFSIRVWTLDTVMHVAGSVCYIVIAIFSIRINRFDAAVWFGTG